MPELPEVETIRRQLERLLVGARIVTAGSHPSAKFSSAPAACGASITEIARRGKYLLIGLDDERQLVVHLGMTGAFSVIPAAGGRGGGTPPGGPYTRAWWGLADGRTVLFEDTRRFGRIAVVVRGDYETLPTLRELGPEPFDAAFTPHSLWQALRRHRRRLKTQLLSQRPVAGVGNIYADEAFWLARVHPARRTITRAEAERLHGGILTALDQGLRSGGTTLRDYRGVDGSRGTNQHGLNCYGRAGSPCPRCDAVLVAAVFDARTTTWCERCQGRAPGR
jgi:formamidopyrimidine-DNA glycosylase